MTVRPRSRSSGRDTSACRSRCAPSTWDITVVGYDTSAERIDALRSGRSYVGDVSDERLGAALAAGYLPSRDPLDLRAFDVAVITVPTPLSEGVPDLWFIEAAGRDVLAASRARRAGRARVHDLSRDDRGAAAPDSRRRAAYVAGVDFFLGYSPERIDPGNPRVELREHAEGRVGYRRNSRARPSKRSTARSSTRSCPSASPAKPSWSSCSRTRSAT